MRFSYTAATPAGKITSGRLEALSRTAAVQTLQRQQLAVVKLAQVKAESGVWRVRRMRLESRMLLAQHLTTLLQAGVSLLEALRVVESESSNRQERKLLRRVNAKVNAGTTLAAALDAQGTAFDPLFVNLVRVGESSGTLEENLGYLADELEKRLTLREKLRSALAYPSLVVGVTVALGLVLVLFVLPRIVPLFHTLQVELPWTTKLLLWAATAVRTAGWQVVVLLAALVVAVRLALQVQPLRLLWHRWWLAAPLVGRVMRSISLANFSRTLGTLLKSGVPVLEALDITAETTRHLAYRRECYRLREAVAAGQSLAAAMAARDRRAFFPALSLSLIRVGESSGRLDSSLRYLNRFYERDVDTLLKDLTVILEPALLVFIGLVVALVASSIISPIYQITSSLRVR